MGRTEQLSHLLFMDDVPMFCYCAKYEGRALKKIMDLFCGAMGMVINKIKSAIYFPKIEEDLRHPLSIVFSFPSHDLQVGVKYLGYMPKTNNYGIEE
jgi:hypothetical protein